MVGLAECAKMDDTGKKMRWMQTGAIIRRYREARDLKQEELAKRIRKMVPPESTVAKSSVQISRIETGTSGTSAETIDAIIAALGNLTESEKDALYKASRYTEDRAANFHQEESRHLSNDTVVRFTGPANAISESNTTAYQTGEVIQISPADIMQALATIQRQLDEMSKKIEATGKED